MELRLITEKIIAEVAEAYADIFRDPPWGENSRCQKGNFSSALVGTLCSCCGGILTPAYPPEETGEYIRSETIRKGNKSRAYLALVGEQLAGFGWGYYLNSERELLDKYKGLGEGEEAERFRTALFNNPYLPLMGEDILYVSEVGVKARFRNQGIGSELLGMVIGDAKNVVLRTNLDSPMANLARKAGLEQVYLKDKFKVQVLDPSNSRRVLFVKKPFIPR